MSRELYCELTPVKPVYEEMREGKPFAYGCFSGQIFDEIDEITNLKKLVIEKHKSLHII